MKFSFTKIIPVLFTAALFFPACNPQTPSGSSSSTSTSSTTTTIASTTSSSTTTTTTTTVNVAPIVDAGTNQSALAGDMVNLYATATDGDGDTLSYAWTEGSSSITINNANTLTPSFTAPMTPGDYVFTLTVSDDVTNISDSVTVTVFMPVSGIYVSSSGDDGNDGLSASTPKQSLQDAIDLLTNGDTLFIAGDFSPSATLNLSKLTNIVISGGWNSDFTLQGAPSTLQGSFSVTPIAVMTNGSSLLLTNLLFTGANNIGKEGGGLWMYYSSSNTISCIFSNNVASQGGALHLRNCKDNIINGYFTTNRSQLRGGAIWMLQCYNNTIAAVMTNNYAGNYGGAICLYSGGTNTIDSTIVANNCANHGGGIYIYENSATISGLIAGNNAAANDGGGIYCDAFGDHSISATIINNTCGGNGGGISFYNSTFSSTITALAVITNNNLYGIYDNTVSSINIIESGAVYSPNTPGDLVNINEP